MQKKAVAGIFDQIEYLLKAGITAVVRVRHHRAIELLTKLGEASDFAVVTDRLATLCGVPVADTTPTQCSVRPTS